MIHIDPTARVSSLADIEDSTRGTRIVVGPRAVIDAFVKIKPAGGSGDVEIGPECVINSGCVLLDGAILRQGCVIAAGSVVRGEIEAYSIQGGNPLKLLGRREATGD